MPNYKLPEGEITSAMRRSACSFIRTSSDFQETKDAIRAAGFMTLQDMEIMTDPILVGLAIELGWNQQAMAQTSDEVH